jgi:hypothetical protein
MFIRQMAGGSRQQVPGPHLTMHEHRQSYRAVVPAKSLNKTGQPTVAEGMEGRALVQGNEFQRNTNRAQYRRIVSRELERVWAIVIEGVHEILCLSPSSLRQEPDALIAPVRVRAGGGEQSPSLPRLNESVFSFGDRP